MERKLITDSFFVNFVLTKKFKGLELGGHFLTSLVFEKCRTRDESEGKIFFFANDEELLKITFYDREIQEIRIFMNFKNACFYYNLENGKNNFEKIKKFFSEVVAEINENDGN